jgi:hypothetical protein
LNKQDSPLSWVEATQLPFVQTWPAAQLQSAVHWAPEFGFGEQVPRASQMKLAPNLTHCASAVHELVVVHLLFKQ